MPIEVHGKVLPRNSMFYNIPVSTIEVDPGFNIHMVYDEQRHQDLKAFIKENGIPGALLVYKDGDRFVLVDGHNRLRAVRELNTEGCELETVTVEFERAGQTAAERLVTALSRNEGQRLTPLEEANVFRRFVSWRWTHEKIAQRVGKSTSFVTQRLALLEATPELVQALEEKTITPTTAVQIVRDSRNGVSQAQGLSTRYGHRGNPDETAKRTSLKSFTKSLDKIGIDDAIQAFIAYAQQEEFEYLIQPFTLALASYKAHNTVSQTMKKGYIGEE